MLYRFLAATGFAIASHAGCAQSYLLVGQTVGTTVVTLNPVVSLLGQAIYSPDGGTSGQQQLIDVDNDGINDLVISASGTAGSGGKYPWHTAAIKVLRAEVELYANPPTGLGYGCAGLASGDTLQPVMHRRNATGALGSWSSASSINPLNGTTSYNSLLLSSVANGANGQISQGDWLDLQTHYAGFRLRASVAAPWRYGWLRVQVSSRENPVTLNIQAYALASSLLSLQAANTAGWQLYPVPATNLLTVQSAAATAGQLTLTDAQGRVHLRQAFAGTSQQLDLSALAAGLYLVRLETSAGSFAQRIAKQ